MIAFQFHQAHLVLVSKTSIVVQAMASGEISILSYHAWYNKDEIDEISVVLLYIFQHWKPGKEWRRSKN